MQHSNVSDDAQFLLFPEDQPIFDHGIAERIAADYHRTGSTELALAWDRIATFLKNSEDYLLGSRPALQG